MTMKSSFRYQWILTGVLGLFLGCSLLLFANPAQAQSDKTPRTPSPTDQSVRDRPLADTTRDGVVCKAYARGLADTLYDCPSTNGTTKVCLVEQSSIPTGSVIGVGVGNSSMTVACDIWTSNGSFLGYEGDTITYDGFGTTIQTDPETGNVTGVSNPILDPVVDTVVGMFTCTINGLFDCFIGGIAYIILMFANFLLGTAGAILNWVVVRTVFEFSTFIGNSPGVLLAWSILRDLGNMLLLFGFIFIGIATILDLQTYSAKRALPRLIIFAILMNFSLFAAGAVIDTSNVLSSVLYNQSSGDACSGGTNQDCAVNVGIASNIMTSSGIYSIVTFDDKFYNVGPIVLMVLALFATIAAAVLFAAAIMLAIRAIVLTFLMVLAPIGFAALAVPALEKHGKEWWNKLIHQSFFAPILLLLIFISLKITESLASADSNRNMVAALKSQDAGSMGVIMLFLLVIGFMIASLMVAKKFGAMGADFAIKTAGGITAGSLAFAGRRTIGRASYRAGMAIQNTRFGQTEFGRMTSRAAGSLGTRSFDLRTGSLASFGAKAANLDFGQPNRNAAGGYAAERRASIAEKQAYADSFDDGRRATELRTQTETRGRQEQEFQNAQQQENNLQENINRQEQAVGRDRSGDIRERLEEMAAEERRNLSTARARNDAAATQAAEARINEIQAVLDNGATEEEIERWLADTTREMRAADRDGNREGSEAARRKQQQIRAVIDGIDAQRRQDAETLATLREDHAQSQRNTETAAQNLAATNEAIQNLENRDPRRNYANRLERTGLMRRGTKQTAARQIRARMGESGEATNARLLREALARAASQG